MFTTEGAFVEQIGGPGAGDGRFESPVDVAPDASGSVYVADRGRGRVHRFAETTPPLPAPVPGRTANVESLSGTVLVRRPGASGFVRLVGAQPIPIGSLVHATSGVVRLTTARDARGGQQAARFYAGRFRIWQSAASPLTELDLVGGSFDDCRRAGARARVRFVAKRKRKRSKKVVRRLWGDGEGRFRTDGNYGSAGVRGTIWLTEDRCDGTLVRVRRGTVEVRDLPRRRTVTLTAGRSYLARAPG